MKKDGTLTKTEERTVSKAFGIIQEWLDLHTEDERPPRNFYDINSAYIELSNDWDVMRSTKDTMILTLPNSLAARGR